MPILSDEVSVRARGGSELMKLALAEGLKRRGREDLLELFDVYGTRVREFNPNRPSIYWVQDLAADLETKHLAEDRHVFSAIVFASHWQQQEFQRRYQMTRQNQAVLLNAIQPFEPQVMQKWSEPGLGSAQRPIRLIYHTTPHRGLELLVPAFGQIWNHFQSQGIHLHLDVFSSFSIYGWEDQDEPYKKVFDACRQHPAITYHGAVSNELVRDALRRSHVFAYPSVWPETSCVALIEAMGSGCVCVHSNLAALPETAGGMTVCYPHVPDTRKHFHMFTRLLHGTLAGLHSAIGRQQPPALAVLGMQRANFVFSWETRIQEWIGLLSGLKNQASAGPPSNPQRPHSHPGGS